MADKSLTHMSHILHLDKMGDTDDGVFDPQVPPATAGVGALDALGPLRPEGWPWQWQWLLRQQLSRGCRITEVR